MSKVYVSCECWYDEYEYIIYHSNRVLLNKNQKSDNNNNNPGIREKVKYLRKNDQIVYSHTFVFETMEFRQIFHYKLISGFSNLALTVNI